MAAQRTRFRNPVEHDASVWAARLDTGDMDEASRADLDRWLDADPEHGAVLSRYRQLCGDLADQVPVLADPADVDTIVRRARLAGRLSRVAWPACALAAVLAVAALVWWRQPLSVETGVGERRTLALEDGSRIELNACTSVEIRFDRGERRVRLARGEALFQVAPDRLRPFFVDSERGSVRVTGTVFNVRDTTDGRMEVTVIEGAVQVSRPTSLADPVPLASGGRASVSETRIDVSPITSDEGQNAIAWRVGMAAFQEAPLGRALGRFRSYHAGRITVSQDASGLRVGGRFSLDDLEGFLVAVEQALPVTVLRGADGDVRIVLTPRREPQSRGAKTDRG